jgi:ABC-2 type transport system permease protein
MTLTLTRKLLRDLRVTLPIVMVFLGLFQCFWAKITERILGQLTPMMAQLSAAAGLKLQDVEDRLFAGPGQIVRTIIGGERLVFDSANDLMSIGYVHPLMLIVFCIWAVGRSSGAIAGEIDRGTMELLLAQPLSRSRLLLAHLLVDLVTIPLLCLGLWCGTWLGVQIVGTIEEQPLEVQTPPREMYVDLFALGPVKVSIRPPGDLASGERLPSNGMHERLTMQANTFLRALPVVGGLIFAVGGYTMWISACGRYRWRVLGVAVLVTLVQFLINVIGQLWQPMDGLRPLTVFYYYQPQQVVLGNQWWVPIGGTPREPLLRVPMLLVLYGVGLAGYALAWWTFRRRDLPAPL